MQSCKYKYLQTWYQSLAASHSFPAVCLVALSCWSIGPASKLNNRRAKSVKCAVGWRIISRLQSFNSNIKFWFDQVLRVECKMIQKCREKQTENTGWRQPDEPFVCRWKWINRKIIKCNLAIYLIMHFRSSTVSIITKKVAWRRK